MKRKNRGFTLLELVVVVAIIGALVLLLMPVLRTTRQRAQLVKCMNNERQLSIAALLYAGEHNGEIPDIAPDPSNPDASLANSDYVEHEDLYICPRDTRSEDDFGPFKTSYTATLFTPSSLFTTGTVSQYILYIESDEAGVLTRDQITDLSFCTYRHGGITTIAYADGAVISYNEDSGDELVAKMPPRGRRRKDTVGDGKPDYTGTPRDPQEPPEPPVPPEPEPPVPPEPPEPPEEPEEEEEETGYGDDDETEYTVDLIPDDKDPDDETVELPDDFEDEDIPVRQ